MKKGFTLVELLAVIAVIGFVAVITIPVVDKILDSSRTKAYEEQKKLVEKRAEEYLTNNISLLSEDGDTFVSVNVLVTQGYFDQDELINPKTGEKMNGCVKASYSSNYDKYIFTYSETCE